MKRLGVRASEKEERTEQGSRGAANGKSPKTSDVSSGAAAGSVAPAAQYGLDKPVVYRHIDKQFLFDEVNVTPLAEYPRSFTPAVITPRGGRDSVEFLVDFAARNRAKLTEMLYVHGAILFRGFRIGNPQQFEDSALSLHPKLNDVYHGTSPRNMVTRFTFTASELPNFFPIPQHLEMSFLKSKPSRLFFWCGREPAWGGSTPLCHFGLVWQDLPADLRASFRRKGVRYVRNYVGPRQRRWDPTQLKAWPEVFRSTDKAVVEEDSAKEDVRVSWGKGDALRLINDMPAIMTHPVTKNEIWHNHSQVFHSATAFQEYRRIARHTKMWRFWAWALVGWLLVIIKRLFTSPYDQPLNTLYGDGSEIPDRDMERVRDVVWKHMIPNPWRVGDVVMIDNHAVSHGRLPYGDSKLGKRQVLVAWSAD